MHTWSIRQAKDQLSALLQAANLRPQVITNRGVASYVILTQDEYSPLARRSASDMLDFFASSGLEEIPLERIAADERNDFEL